MLVNCSVCLGDINLLDGNVSILNCGHFFHAGCLNNCLNEQLKCPECRAVVRRGNFARNIILKFNQETVSQFKMLKDKCSKLQEEVSLLKLENSCLRES